LFQLLSPVHTKITVSSPKSLFSSLTIRLNRNQSVLIKRICSLFSHNNISLLHIQWLVSRIFNLKYISILKKMNSFSYPIQLMKNVCILLGSQFRIKYVRENVFIFLPQANIKKNVCILLGNITFYRLTECLVTSFKENVFIFLPPANIKKNVCIPLGIPLCYRLYQCFNIV